MPNEHKASRTGNVSFSRVLYQDNQPETELFIYIVHALNYVVNATNVDVTASVPYACFNRRPPKEQCTKTNV